eukprot:m.624916 g.624916  ORF g.624916 m.624916 type:complete len:68 (+) comp22546_c0_seq10:1548-1751(+)
MTLFQFRSLASKIQTISFRRSSQTEFAACCVQVPTTALEFVKQFRMPAPEELIMIALAQSNKIFGYK